MRVKNILTLNHEEAMEFFIKSEQYHGFELLEYFMFDGLLRYKQETISDTPYGKHISDWLIVLDKKKEGIRKRKGPDLGLNEGIEDSETKGIFSQQKTNTPKKNLPNVSIRAMSAFYTKIILENFGCVFYALRILSRMVYCLAFMDEKQSFINLVYQKLNLQPNNDCNHRWLQNITYIQEKKNEASPFSLRLVQLVAGKDVGPL